jgi:hypothetical protein
LKRWSQNSGIYGRGIPITMSLMCGEISRATWKAAGHRGWISVAIQLI